MILHIIIFKNKVIDTFTTPVYDDHNPLDAATQLSRTLRNAKASKDEKLKEAIIAYRFLDMYDFGTFDDSTGEFKLKKAPVKLLDCTKVLGLEDELKSILDGREEESA